MKHSDRIWLSSPDVGPRERTLLLEAFDSNWIAPLGPMVDRFEKVFSEYMGGTNAVALSSGTAGLHLLLHEAGVRAGDDVCVATFTFVATANAVRYCGANPIWIDSEEASWNMDPDCLEQALAKGKRRGKLPKAILAVDIYGQSANYDRLSELAAAYGVPLIEDAAEAMGARYKGQPCGTFGIGGVFSFNGNKIITTSGGGMVTTANRKLAERLRYLSTQARDPYPHNEHSEVGYNYRLSNLLAAVGIGQLESLPQKIENRKAIWKRYAEEFAGVPGIRMMPIPDWSQPNYWLTCIELDPALAPVTPDQLRIALAAENIESRPLWKPMHLQPIYKDYPLFATGVSARLFERGLSLPSGSNMTELQWLRIRNCLRQQLRIGE